MISTHHPTPDLEKTERATPRLRYLSKIGEKYKSYSSYAMVG